MERTVTLERPGLTVTVKELTVGDVRGWIQRMQGGDGTFDIVDGALFQEEGAAIEDVVRMTSLDAGEIDQLTCNEVSSVLKKCKEVNPHFFRFRAAMVDIGLSPVPEQPPSQA